jgi:hypothetical protein
VNLGILRLEEGIPDLRHSINWETLITVPNLALVIDHGRDWRSAICSSF